MNNNLSIALVGASGRMGLEIFRAANRYQGIRIVSAVEARGSCTVGQDLGVLSGVGRSEVIVEDSLQNAISKATVVVDLSLPAATEAVVTAARNAKKPLVCGTTGLGNNILELFQEASSEIPLLYTTNLSPGITLMQSLIRKAVQTLRETYDIEIVEMHHRRKVDAPSGTALTLAETAARARGLDPKSVIKSGRAGHTGERSPEEIGIHAIRGGGVFGDHTCILAGENERLEITHKASSRALFAEGALMAARFLAGKPPGSYTMAEVLGV